MNEAPDTAMSVLELFSPSKEGVVRFANQVIAEVENGERDPLRVKLLCKTLEEVADRIDKGTKEAQRKEAAKHGERPFMFHGAEIHLTSVKTEYIYDNCNDPEYLELVEKAESAKTALEARKEFLKNLPPEGTTIVIESTGEAVLVRRPAKRQQEGVKISLK